MRFTKRQLVSTVLACGCLTGAAAPAFADTDWWKSSDGNPGAQAKFSKQGDKVTVCDIQEDGFRAVVNVYKTYANAPRKYVYTVTDSKAAGVPPYNCTSVNAASGRRYDLREGWSYQLVVCIDKNRGRDRFCSSPLDFHA